METTLLDREMRNAVVLYGLPRYNKKTVRSMKKNLLCNGKADIFCHFWFGGEAQRTHTKLKQPDYVDALSLLSLMKKLKFDLKKVQLQPSQLHEPIELETSYGKINYSNQLSMFNSMCTALDLIDKKCEYKNIIFARTDLLFISKFPLNELNDVKFGHCGFWNEQKKNYDCDDTLFSIQPAYSHILKEIRSSVIDRSIYSLNCYNLLFANKIKPQKLNYEYGHHFHIKRRLRPYHYLQSLYNKASIKL